MARSDSLARRWARRVLPMFVVGAALSTFAFLGTAGAGMAGPSDDRATFVPGNPNTCEEAGTPASNVLSQDPPVDASDGNVSGDISDYDPAIDDPPGSEPAADDATKLNVTILNPDVVIVGVIVKGGPQANVYPTAVQNMISPFNNGGNIPAISHYLICYNFGAPPPPNGNGGNGGNGGGGDGGAAAAEQARAPAAVRAQAQFTG
jgi:hypothetical protein